MDTQAFTPPVLDTTTPLKRAVVYLCVSTARLYETDPEGAKQRLFHALFTQLKVGLHDENGSQATASNADTIPASTATLAPVTEAVLTVVCSEHEQATRNPRQDFSYRGF